MTYSDIPNACDASTSVAGLAHHGASHIAPTASQAAIHKLTAAHAAHHASHGGLWAWWTFKSLKVKALMIILPCVVFGPPIALYAPDAIDYASQPHHAHGYYPVPEPSTLWLFGVMAVVIIAARGRARRSAGCSSPEPKYR